MTIVLAIVAMQNVWNMFNNETSRQLATLVERVSGVERRMDEGRARRDGQVNDLESRLRTLESHRAGR